jgi:molybdopterin molybdotransferase
MPKGADAVVAIEDLRDECASAWFVRTVGAGSGVEPAGSDVPAGALLLEQGEVVSPRRAALLAALGFASVQVHRRPRVAILVTGSEHAPGAGVPPSNGVLLAGLVEEAGGAVTRLEWCPDDEAVIAQWLLEPAPSDLVLTSGGTGRSAADRMPAALGLAGAEPLFRGLAVRPGHTTLAARLGVRPVVALPGTPAAAAVVFELLVRPALRRLKGVTPGPETWELSLTAAIPAGRPGRRMVWGCLRWTGASLAVEPLLGPAAGPTLAAALGDVLVDLPDGGSPVPLGSGVTVFLAGSHLPAR